MKKKWPIFIIASLILLIIISLSKISNFIINVQWFKEVSYLSIYFTKMIAIIKLFIPTFFICFICILLYYNSLKKSIYNYRSNKNDRFIKYDKGKKIFFVANTVMSLILSCVFSYSYWYNILKFNNSVPFNIKDPIFYKDISFYVFKLPLIESIYSGIMTLLGFLIIITIVMYFIFIAKDKIDYAGFKGVFTDVKEIRSDISKFAGKQLAIISAMILLMLSLGFLIKAWNLVYSPRGVAFGASYTDIHVSIIFYKIIILISIVSSIIVFISVIKSKVKPIIISISLIAILIVGENVASLLVENFVVKSNQKKLEEEYIKYNIDYTRKAFNIDNIKEINFDVKNDLKLEDIKNNKETINNIRINAFEPALEFYNQYQTIRPYYIFNDMDIDRYKIKGKYNQVFISPRELNLENIEPDTWQNRHLIYTHGYGVAVSKVNSVTQEGQPDFVIKDIPSENNIDISLKNPRIYFGEKTNNYAIVNTALKEFDYPKGGDNKINEYDGKSGIKMSFINKVLFSIKENNLNFLLSRDITKDSRILINRNIVDRAKKVAPFLTYDEDPYVVIDNDRLYWIIDGYTTTDKYPYAEKYNDVNYIRNSVKVVIDAVDGDIDFYIVDKNDPIILSYSKIYPKLFKDSSDVPPGIKEHFKYPEDIFKLQCKVLEKYHMIDPMAFLNGDDLWEVSKNQKSVNTDKSIDEAPYVVMKMQGENKEEMVVLEYFNMKERNTMSSILGARMDGKNYGKLIMYKLPSYKTIYSPYFFKQKLKQDPIISKELSLWNTGGSEVKFGDTIIVPINNSLLYIESMYLRASGKSSAPEVKRIVLSYGDKIILSENIDGALKQLFSYNGKENNKNSSVNSTKDEETNKFLKDARDLYNKAIESQKSGDWSKYGEYIKKLGEILNSINK
ncbi:UPF0182 family protein [Clostridium rectalis]|uniref:UPF0182 family protein n=1 Tax=Clostridium rectalis TaxID=2040295 RepID=UPI000F63AA02|nr:UPF0182 family protein [Clostridium rectalis]